MRFVFNSGKMWTYIRKGLANLAGNSPDIHVVKILKSCFLFVIDITIVINEIVHFHDIASFIGIYGLFPH